MNQDDPPKKKPLGCALRLVIVLGFLALVAAVQIHLDWRPHLLKTHDGLPDYFYLVGRTKGGAYQVCTVDSVGEPSKWSGDAIRTKADLAKFEYYIPKDQLAKAVKNVNEAMYGSYPAPSNIGIQLRILSDNPKNTTQRIDIRWFSDPWIDRYCYNVTGTIVDDFSTGDWHAMKTGMVLFLAGMFLCVAIPLLEEVISWLQSPSPSEFRD